MVESDDLDTFWNVVAQINYPENHLNFKHSYSKVHVFLLRRYSEQVIDQFYKTLRTLSLRLYKRCEKFDLGSDTTGDATAFAVSFGKERYHKLLESQREFDKFVLDCYCDYHRYYDFRESFAYCFLLPERGTELYN